MFVITGATSSHAPHFALRETSLMPDFDAEQSFPTVHAHGLTERAAMPQKPYVRGAYRTQAERIRESWNAANPFNPMP